MNDPVKFAKYGAGLSLRRYQVEVARRVVESVKKKDGKTFVVIFPRQSGKNELQAQIEGLLLLANSRLPAEMVKISPTWKPQSLNAMRRLERVLDQNKLTVGLWQKETGYCYRLGRARIYFLSGSPETHIVGATANLLLECDEAQDVQETKWDKDVAPMAASSNATRVFWGTAWSAQTLLSREYQAALAAQAQDGEQRVWRLSVDDIRSEVPAYGAHVDEQVRRLGSDHPLVRSQYFSEDVDQQARPFNAARLALIAGDHPRQHSPTPGVSYAFLIDVAGEDEAAANGQLSLFAGLLNPGRDSTVLTVVAVDADEGLLPAGPLYRVVERQVWTGERHASLYARLRALIELWQPRFVVIDATGVGAGLAGFLSAQFPERVLPFTFSQATKSRLGWSFLALIETGRFKDWRVSGAHDEAWQLLRQMAACEMETLPGPGKLLRWGVPDGRRDGQTGELLHDDLLISAALCCVLDEQKWGEARSAVLPPPDLFEGLEF
jgi:hypothetical protein